MNEPFDTELSRALKDGADKSLQGWEFTPAMRARVRERVRAEADGDSAPVSPPRRFPTARTLRPLAWVAVAAAAVAIVANTDLFFKGAGSGQMNSTTSAPAQSASKSAAQSPAPAPAQTTATPGSTPPVAGGTAFAPQPNSVQPHTDAATANPAETFTGSVDTDGMPGAAGTDGNVGGEPGVKAVQAPAALAFELTVPEAGSLASGGPVQPKAAQGVTGSRMSIAAAPPQNLGMAVAGSGPVLSLSPYGVKAVGPDGASVWERPLADLGPQSVLAAAADGRTAVANGSNVLYLLNPQGELVRTLYSTTPIGQLVWSADGRLASAEGSQIVVYNVEAGKPLFHVDAGSCPLLAFAPDGALVAYGNQEAGAQVLTVLDQNGALAWQARPAVAGKGLAIVGDGSVVVAGGQAYDRMGRSLWQVPLETAGLAPLGKTLLAAWDGQTVMAVAADDGHTVWKASWNGQGAIQKVASSPDGRFVAIVAPVPDGAVLWVVDSSGKLLSAEKLPQMPVDIAVAGNQVVLLMPQGVQYREVAQ